MNMHKNARLTPRGREHVVSEGLSGQTPEAAARAAGVCPRTVRKWVARFKAEGMEGLEDRSSRPRRLRRPTPVAIVEKVEAPRRQRWTGRQIAAEVGSRRRPFSTCTMPLITRRSSTRGFPRVSVGQERPQPSELLLGEPETIAIHRSLPSETVNHKPTANGIPFPRPRLGVVSK